jgi:4,5-dihydroxyphthalate decarboxylase
MAARRPGEPGREERAKINLPRRSTCRRCRPTGPSRHAGEGRDRRVVQRAAPSCFLRGAPKSGRLFPDYPAVEAAYFKKTKLFPIMHGIGIRRSIVEKYPWVAVNVYKAFLKAKALCMAELAEIGHLHSTLPWPVHCLRSCPRGDGRGLLAVRRA